MSAVPDVSFIIVNYFSEEFTRKCLASIRQQTSGASFELIVVDNGSGLQAQMLGSQDGLRVILNRSNVGYGAALDIGARQAKGKYLYFLNNDLEFQNDAASIQFQFLETHPAVGLAGVRLVDRDGRHTPAFDYFPSLSSKFLGTEFLRWFCPGRFPRRDGSVTTPTDVDLVSGSSLFMPRAFYLEIGGFDPMFFLYCEEEDLAMRVHQAGRRVVHLPEAVVAHVGGGSSKDKPALKKEFYISYFAFYRKHYGWFRTQILVTLTGGQFLLRWLFHPDRPMWAGLMRWLLRGHPASESLRPR